MRLLIVTPMHNEEANVAPLHASLASQTFTSFDWLVVDDGSDDQTAARLSELVDPPRPRVLTKRNDGGLIGGSAYTSWRFGVEAALANDDTRMYTHVMKLDADVRLPPTYLEVVLASMALEGAGIAGGVLVGRGDREQSHHVPGPVKLYTKDAYASLGPLPSAIGFDVMDEICVAAAGMSTSVVKTMAFSVARAIGASEGGIHGRYRNGRVCRWTGYYPPYFLLHAVRYLFRTPRLVGTIAMLIGYLRAGPSPYPRSLREAHSRLQRQKLRSAARAPVRWYRDTYRY